MSSDEPANGREVMIVVLGDEEEVVDHARGGAANALENVRERLPREPELESAIEPAAVRRGMDIARAHRVIDGPIRP